MVISTINMFDTDKFIQCVQDNFALWEKVCKEYSNRNNNNSLLLNVREKCWDMTGKEMYESWDEMSTAITQQKGNNKTIFLYFYKGK